MDAEVNYRYWLDEGYFDSETIRELRGISRKPKEIRSRFEKYLEFGTGGLRGLMGAGTNRMNIYTVRLASQGLANHINRQDGSKASKGIVIAYDSRNNSDKYALEAAKVFAGNNVPAYVFDGPAPTPLLSFAVRHLKAAAGVVITASHNPRQYNGYKVYNEDGAQMVPEETDLISDEIGRITDVKSVKLADPDHAERNGLLRKTGSEIAFRYIEYVKEITARAGIKNVINSLKIVYTPLHGTGGRYVKALLSECGFRHVITVKSQELPDGNFPGLRSSPNPEEKSVYRRAVRVAEKENADIILATDPDSDRLGVMVRGPKGGYILLSGNQAGVLMLEYTLSQSQKKSQLPKDARIIKTIVTTEMARAAAASYNAGTMEVLTGFKYIGEKIGELEESKAGKFIFGLEDSCGYLFGTEVRDKDGILAALLICEAAAFYKNLGMSMYEALQLLYRKYGYYSDDTCSIELTEKGCDTAVLMQKLRDGANMFSGLNITGIRDYLEQKRYCPGDGRSQPLSLPRSDVLYFEIENGWFCIRPSGTEPKIKLYFETREPDEETAAARLKMLKKRVLATVRKQIRQI